MRLWSTVVSQLQRALCSPWYSAPYAGAEIAVVAKSCLRLLQCGEVSDDVGDLLIGQSAGRRRDFRFENRIVFVQPQRWHQHVGFHLARVLDPKREVSRGIGEA